MKLAIIIAFILIVALVWRTELQSRKNKGLTALFMCLLDDLQNMEDKVAELEEQVEDLEEARKSMN